LTTLLTKTGQQLPLATRLLIATSEFFAHYWWALGLAAAVIFVAHRIWVRTRVGRMTWDRLKLKLPLIGRILKLNFLAQYLQTLSTLVGNAVVLLSGLLLVRNACENTHIRGIFDTLCLQVGEGASLSSVGEQTGNIGFALQRGAHKYDKEFSTAIQRLTILIQPVTILFVALFVGLVAYSMITGILTTVSGLRMR
jgi:type II secretory pathway component PulF